ncbi:Asp-tRNA(Asn)/Glu-tRNA(Gln) amidotransferase subunit GatC [Candidatus Giovannonibacteria bacterium]|nr:Asp-tRNA(Asn)/Glu-tRNA(Gln) amidotransferase subunit GatC [Candidatus Giovannonibacteria bacterium]
MISKEDIEHLKNLARVEFGEKETEALARDLSGILDFINKLSEADISEASETTHAAEIMNVMRKDDDEDFFEMEGRESIVSDFPEKETSKLLHEGTESVWLKVKAPIQKE